MLSYLRHVMHVSVVPLPLLHCHRKHCFRGLGGRTDRRTDERPKAARAPSLGFRGRCRRDAARPLCLRHRRRSSFSSSLPVRSSSFHHCEVVRVRPSPHCQSVRQLKQPVVRPPARPPRAGHGACLVRTACAAADG